MRFLALGIVLTLVWFLIVDAALAGMVTAVARACRNAWAERPAARARFLVALRLLPGMAAAAFALFGFVPIFWRLEPHGTTEAVGPLLLVGSLAALLLVAIAIHRGWRVARHARREAWRWQRDARPLMVDGRFTASIVEDRSSTIALVGAVRPRLFIARPVLDVLTPAELQSVVAHERGHQRSHDNLKRLAVAWWPGVLALTKTGAWLEREWARAAELAADAAAAGRSPVRALDLASALVKVARLAAVPSSALHSTLHDGSDIARRVRRLATVADGVTPPSAAPRGCLLVGVAGLACLGALGVIAFAPHLVALVHGLTELLVRGAR